MARTLRGARALSALETVGTRVGALWARWVRPAVRTLTPVGAAVLVVGAVSWLLAWQLGWTEMAVLATAVLVLLVGSAFFMIGTTRLAVSSVVEPSRVSVGEPLTGELRVTNTGKAPLLSTELEFPIGSGGLSIALPTLLGGRDHHELFVVPTQRRGVIDIGPVSSVRGDPVGLFRRELTWTERAQVYVHPRITPLEPLGAGLVRDLEGTAAQTVSMSDLSFHALREYVPGDDLRHVHWRSSARHGQLLVRQFLDTRRSHLTAVVDSEPESYLAEDDYETALSVAASLMVRALRDEYDVSFLSGGVVSTGQRGKPALDGCSRAVPGTAALVDVAARGARVAPETSLAVIITGPRSDFGTLRRAASQFSVEAGRVAVRVDATATAGLRTEADLPVLTIGRLDELGRILRWGLG